MFIKQAQRRLNQIIKKNNQEPIALVPWFRFKKHLKNETTSRMNLIASGIQKVYQSRNQEDIELLASAYDLYLVDKPNNNEMVFIQRSTLTKYECESEVVTINAFEGDSWFISIKDQDFVSETINANDLIDFYLDISKRIELEENPIEKRMLEYSLVKLSDEYKFYAYLAESVYVFLYRSQLIIVNKSSNDRQSYDVKPISRLRTALTTQSSKLNYLWFVIAALLMSNFFYLTIRFDTIAPEVILSDYQHEILEPLIFDNLVDRVIDDFDLVDFVDKRIVSHGDILNPGEALVVLSVKDSSNNERIIQTRIPIIDTTAPELVVDNNLNIVEYDDLIGYDYTRFVLRNEDNHKLKPVVVNLPTELQRVEQSKPLGEYRINYLSEDLSGNKSQASKFIRVVDTVPPSFNLSENSITIDLDDFQEYDFQKLIRNVQDNYDSNRVVVTTFSSFSYPNVGNFIFRYTAEDFSGNTSSRDLSVRVIDTTPPVLSTVARLTLNVNDVGTFDPSRIISSVTDNHQISSYEYDSIDLLRNRLGNVTYGVTVKDPSGNTTRRTSVISIVDTTPPVMTLTRQSLTLSNRFWSYNELLSFVSEVTDNFDRNPTFRAEINNNGSSRRRVGNNTVVLTATDSSGNTSRQFVSIVVVDTIAPIIEFKDNTRSITITSGQAVSSGLTRANFENNVTGLFQSYGDNLWSQSDLRIFVTLPTNYEPTRIGTYTINTRIEDPSGNLRTYQFTLRIIANPSPPPSS